MTDPPTTIFTSESTETSSYVSTSPPKRKRRPAGTPDPDAEVVALSPKTLMESDRYVCEICNQGFQRDQNLQMHRRRHKVPWKLLKRIDPEVRKRVYVCPESSCLHHNPCHALGDLVGIKKHYRRKHSSMKQWECDKCSKTYAVQSDYKAHLKTCGTRGHCCDCGRVFSRVESFIEHQDTCAAARSKRGIASNSNNQTASLSSLAAAAPDSDHSALLPTIPSNNAEKVMRHNYHNSTAIMNFSLKHLANGQVRGVPALPLLAQSACSDVARITHTCRMIPAKSLPTPATPAFPLPSAPVLPGDSEPAAVDPAHPSAAASASISTWETLQARKPLLQQDKTELQLLPTKPHLNQLESSQSSVTWGKDITSTNSNTSATCSSLALDDRLARKTWLKVPKKSSTGNLAVISPCSKLQLSIGLCHQDDQSTCCGHNIPLQIKSGPAADHQNNYSEPLDPKTTNLQPWLAWSALPPAHKKHDTAPCHAVTKVPLSSCTSDEQQGTITLSTDTYKDAIHLELATGSDHHCTRKSSQTSAACTPQSADVYHELSILEKVQQLKRQGQYLICSRTAAAGFNDQDSSKLNQSSHGEHDGEVMKLLQMQSFCKASSAETGGATKLLLRRNSSCGSIATPEAADHQPQREQSNSLSGSFAEPTPAATLLQCAEKPNFLLEATFMPATAAQGAAEVLLQKAREQLKRASAEKLEAEKAWREARREREKAEEEVARAQRIREYNEMIMEKAAQHEGNNEQVGVATRKPTYSSASSSPSSIANSQASPSSLQMKQNMHEAEGVLCSAPSFITCPTCHHTQILYPSPSHMATLFLASQTRPTTPASNTSHKLPSLPNPIPEL